MRITDYYNNYSTTRHFPQQLHNGSDMTIDDFYKNCISKNLCLVKNVLDWHEMFMKYVDMNDAVLWVRYYESGGKINNRHSNRRACYTEFADGFSYVFVSNFDVHEIYNMVFQGVTPDANEFLDLMKNFQYKLHYDPGISCEESIINSYPNIGTPKAGVLTAEHWYLAHINAVRGHYLRSDGTIRKINRKETNRLYPKGSMNDWKTDQSGFKKRKLNYSLSQEEKDLVKAHFLRFVDPLNYFIVPSVYYEINKFYGNKKKSIGELNELVLYVSHEYESIYGNNAMAGFKNKARVSVPSAINYSKLSKTPIDITYGSVLKTKNNAQAQAPQKSKIKTTKISNINSINNSKTNTTVMSIIKMFAAEGITSSSNDDIGLLMSAKSKRQLASDIIERLYNNHAALFNKMIKSSVKPNHYDFGIVSNAFAEYSVASTSLNKGKSRYFMNKAYNVNGVDLYLSGEWYTISQAKPAIHANWSSINDLIRVLNQCFDANFVYIESGKDCQLWGPSGTL